MCSNFIDAGIFDQREWVGVFGEWPKFGATSLITPGLEGSYPRTEIRANTESLADTGFDWIWTSGVLPAPFLECYNCWKFAQMHLENLIQ
jgi:hypothetical protein